MFTTACKINTKHTSNSYYCAILDSKSADDLVPPHCNFLNILKIQVE